MSVHADQLSDSLAEQIRAAGLDAVRTDLVWWEVLRDGWGKYDAWFRSLRTRGLAPIWILGWGQDGRDGPPSSVASLSALILFAAKAAGRYPGSVWEVWNEPNTERFWPHPDAVDYVAMLEVVARTIHQVDRTASVVSGGLGGPTFDQAWLRAAIEAGLLDYVDAVGLHPYFALEPEHAADYYAAVRAMMGASERPIAVTEWGFSSLNGEAEQADKMLRAVRTNERAGVCLTVVYEWLDSNEPGHEGAFGLHTRDGRAKPVLETLLAR